MKAYSTAIIRPCKPCQYSCSLIVWGTEHFIGSFTYKETKRCTWKHHQTGFTWQTQSIDTVQGFKTCSWFIWSALWISLIECFDSPVPAAQLQAGQIQKMSHDGIHFCYFSARLLCGTNISLEKIKSSPCCPTVTVKQAGSHKLSDLNRAACHEKCRRGLLFYYLWVYVQKR